MKGLMNGFYGVSEWIARFAITNLTWLFFNLPIVFVVINIVFAQSMEHVIILTVPLLILVPFLFFPATAALFASVRNWILKKDEVSLVKGFWNYYKQNYRKSLLYGFILTGLWITWVVNYNYFMNNNNIVFLAVFIVIALVLYVFTINVFSINAHYDLNIKELLKKSLLVTVGSPFLFFSVFMGSAIILYASIIGSLFLIPFCTGSLIAFISYLAFYRLYFKITSNRKQQE